MKFIDLINDPFLQTPRSEIYDGDFLEFVTKNLRAFEDKIKLLESEPKKIPGVNYKPGFILEVTGILIDGLLNCLKLYLDGRINRAYEELSLILTHERKSFYKIIAQTVIEPGSNFYRIRTRNDNTLFSNKEMFHIPYELRGYVKNQRFSITGFPSLYVSSNVYTCWEELKRPNINEFQAIRLNNSTGFASLDLTPPIEKKYSKENYRFLLLWPLIFCCSIKVKKPDDIFKPEYIIPQLLLQWVRENDNIDCIRYPSTNVDVYNSLSEGDFSNYVFPVKENNAMGYCSRLLRDFKSTYPISWQNYQYSLGGVVLTGTWDDPQKGISKLEIIKGQAHPYSYSILGKLEAFLDTMELNDIQNTIK